MQKTTPPKSIGICADGEPYMTLGDLAHEREEQARRERSLARRNKPATIKERKT